MAVIKGEPLAIVEAGCDPLKLLELSVVSTGSHESDGSRSEEVALAQMRARSLQG